MRKLIKRDLFIVDESFQFRYSILLGLSGLIISLVIGFIFYNYSIAQDKILLISGLNQSEDIVSFFMMQHKLLLVKLITIGVIVTLFMFLLGLVVSNKISGPIFSIRRNLNEIAASGDLSIRFKVRKKDELHGLISDLNRVMERLEFDYGKVSEKEND